MAKTEGKPKAAKAADKADKPKRALTPYISFCKAKRPELKAQNPTATFGELGKMLGKLWQEMSQKEKDSYKA